MTVLIKLNQLFKNQPILYSLNLLENETMDVLTNKQRSYCMSRIRAKNTKPELILRKVLRDLNFKFRTDSKLLGKPDVKITGYKIVIFLDGCFWHGCSSHFKTPKQNEEFWIKKITGNKKRDRDQRRELKEKGYHVIRVWEHETKQVDKLILKLRNALEEVISI